LTWIYRKKTFISTKFRFFWSVVKEDGESRLEIDGMVVRSLLV
jgi:hypothetical protein